MTLRHAKHWPTVTDTCRSCYLWNASSKRKPSRKCFQSLHRHSETVLQVLMFLPGLVFCSPKVSLWTEWQKFDHKDPESFITNYLKRSELKDLWSISTGVSSFCVSERPLWSDALLPFHFIWQLLTISATTTFETLSSSWKNLWQHHQMQSMKAFPVSAAICHCSSDIQLFSQNRKHFSCCFKEKLQVWGLTGLIGSSKAGITEI